MTVFDHDTPLHDGAMIIQGSKIIAAGCYLPLSGQTDIRASFGTRHRAALGISKESDSIAVVISEENGKISIAKNGTLIMDVNEEALKKILIKSLVTDRFRDVDMTRGRFENMKETWNKMRKKKIKSNRNEEKIEKKSKIK